MFLDCEWMSQIDNSLHVGKIRQTRIKINEWTYHAIDKTKNNILFRSWIVFESCLIIWKELAIGTNTLNISQLDLSNFTRFQFHNILRVEMLSINIAKQNKTYQQTKYLSKFLFTHSKIKNIYISDKPILKSLLEPKNTIEPIIIVFSYSVEYEI